MTIPALPTTSGTVLSDPYIYEYAPIQYTLVTANTAPVLLSPKTFTIFENTSTVADLAVSDDASSEGNGISYAIVGGLDASRFAIDQGTGVLSFVVPPDYEQPSDSNRDNVYLVTVAISDAIGAANSYALSITVSDANEAPSAPVSAAGLTVAADAWAGATVGYVKATDPDRGSVLTYALLDTLGGAFAIDPTTGRVFLSNAASLQGQGGMLSLAVSATDAGGLSANAMVPVVVTAATGNNFIGTAGDDVAQSLVGLAWYADGGLGNDRLTGSSMADTILGGWGDDWLDGGAGPDILDGGPGFDTVSYAASPAAVQVNLTTGLGAGGYAQGDQLSGIEKLIGSAFPDTLIGDAGDNTLNGGAGDDVLDGMGGVDTVDYSDALAAVTVSLLLTTAQDTKGAGKDTIKNVENITGSAFNDILTGNALANVLDGGLGNDTLNGGLGNDILIGGPGNDILYGGADDDQLFGGAGADRLDGGTGADWMAGGADNDTYYVDNIGDVVDETNGAGGDAGGVDVVISSVSYALTGLAAYVENLTLSGTAAINGTGNDLNNVLTGNAAANVLDGGLGNDTLNGGLGNDILIGGPGNDILYGGADDDQLFGGAGADRLDGGTGADWMAGGADNDTYYVDNIGDVVDETNGAGGDAGGVDVVISSVSYALTGLAAYVENLTLSGTAAINGTGNDLNNVLTGNAAANVLDGGLGNDTLNGGLGNDILIGGPGNDRLTGGADVDTFVFALGSGKDTITDFAPASNEVIQLSYGTAFDTFGEVMAVAKQSGANTIITLSANDTITLLNVPLASLSAANFMFA